MKKIKYLILSVIVTTIFSCNDYLDVNESTNSPTADNVTPDLMLAAALNEPFSNTPSGNRMFASNNSYLNISNELGNVFMNSWAGDVNNVTGAYLEEFALTLNTGFASDIWDNLYLTTGTLTSIINYNASNYNNFKAIAKIMKVYHFQTLVDLYGDAPYSEAHLFGENTTPAYDDDEAIYRDFIIQLNDAISLIDNNASQLNPGTNDVIFGGDMSKWKEFANTVKLRVLLREATKAETNAASATYLNTEFATMTTATFITNDVVLNPGYSDALSKQNPFWAQFGEQPGGGAMFDNGLIVPTDYAAKFLSGQPTQNAVQTSIFDSRLEAMYSTVGGSVVGVIQGDDNTTAPATLSHLRTDPALGLLNSFDQDAFVMTASESYFLQAEAMERGYITGSAQGAFDAGVSASFALLGADQTGYNNDGTNLIGWTGSANKIEAIMTQKWIALMGVNAIQSWIDYTRTGFPAIPLATTAQQAAKPNRLLYPGSEYTANSANVPNQTAQEAFTTHIFWDEN